MVFAWWLYGSCLVFVWQLCCGCGSCVVVVLWLHGDSVVVIWWLFCSCVVATISLYLFEGVIGLPVFAGTPEKGIGLSYFMGPTMGYLIGFLFATFFAGYLNLKKNMFIIFLKLTLSVSIIYIFGILWLGNLIGWDKPILELGLMPFLLAELFKISLLTILAKNLLNLKNLFR